MGRRRSWYLCVSVLSHQGSTERIQDTSRKHSHTTTQGVTECPIDRARVSSASSLPTVFAPFVRSSDTNPGARSLHNIVTLDYNSQNERLAAHFTPPTRTNENQAIAQRSILPKKRRGGVALGLMRDASKQRKQTAIGHSHCLNHCKVSSSGVTQIPRPAIPLPAQLAPRRFQRPPILGKLKGYLGWPNMLPSIILCTSSALLRFQNIIVKPQKSCLPFAVVAVYRLIFSVLARAGLDSDDTAEEETPQPQREIDLLTVRRSHSAAAIGSHSETSEMVDFGDPSGSSLSTQRWRTCCLSTHPSGCPGCLSTSISTSGHWFQTVVVLSRIAAWSIAASLCWPRLCMYPRERGTSAYHASALESILYGSLSTAYIPMIEESYLGARHDVRILIDECVWTSISIYRSNPRGTALFKVQSPLQGYDDPLNEPRCPPLASVICNRFLVFPIRITKTYRPDRKRITSATETLSEDLDSSNRLIATNGLGLPSPPFRGANTHVPLANHSEMSRYLLARAATGLPHHYENKKKKGKDLKRSWWLFCTLLSRTKATDISMPNGLD
ncbi:uncharacterized protein CLUP02_03491 [Colletotrichum lupini]|uniref:Uncharacterized protein n=1 Tax=Colletotrichum lupini TaxID=145971 RepID=A0A9Q8SKA0_9PEZI|nr:uncharacterized protein CLUP02_03491 [Colletotrichum lupini]UQC78017.1 hypothetical protein CLUP02_03491 [Colletotrichum lupini]